MTHRADLCRAFKMLHLIGVPVLSLSHPFQAVHSEGPHSCYQTPSGCLVPLVTVWSNLGATVTKEDCVQGWQLPLTPVLREPAPNANEMQDTVGVGKKQRAKDRSNSLQVTGEEVLLVDLYRSLSNSLKLSSYVLEVNADKLQHFHILGPVILNSSLSWAPMSLVAALTSFL